MTLILNSACNQDLVHQRPVAELNTRAQQLIKAGDYEGAVARLESAHDLDSKEVKTMHNLAVAYQMNGDYDKSIETFEELLDEPNINKHNVFKSLGVTNEAKADLLMSEIEKIKEGKKSLNSAERAAIGTKTQDATGYYQIARSFYLKSLPGLKEKADVEAQVKALDYKLNKLNKSRQG